MLTSELFKEKCTIKNGHCPKISDVEQFHNEALDLIYPGMIRRSFLTVEDLDLFIKKHLEHLKKLITSLVLYELSTESLIEDYQNKIIQISNLIKEDAKALLEGDPAAKDISEVVLSYPGLFAVATYRLAHFFYKKNIPILPRLLSELAHTKTGIDIHPGALIGGSFFIDHGTGVVIGETTIIGNRVKIYQGVTLGALSVHKSLAEVKRHPTIEDDCIIYAHATILGGKTVIGKGSVIGGNVWLTKSVPNGSLVYHRSEIIFDQNRDFGENEEEIIYEI